MRDEILARDKEFDSLSTEYLLKLLHSNSRLYRARALSALARRSSQEEAITPQVLNVITESKNREARLLGSTISVSHIGFATLWEFGLPSVRESLRRLLQDWPEPDRTDLLWFLKSQSISIEEASGAKNARPTVQS